MGERNIPKKFEIVYFSGTGGARRIAEAFRERLLQEGLQVSMNNLDRSIRCSCEEIAADEESFVILVFPVHAFDAPEPIYDWIAKAEGRGRNMAVISASGGGEAWPNTGCRYNCCKELEEKGFKVVYEKMFCMPSNWVFKIDDNVVMWLLKAVPRKVDRIVAELMAGKTRRSTAKVSAARAFITKQEKKAARRFPETLKVNESCTGCGWCAANCPVENIVLQEDRPVFKDKCVMCFRCVYGCPTKAMKSNNFQVLKGGYDLKKVEKRMEGKELLPVEVCCKGMFWSAVRKYLLDKEW